MVKSLHTEDYGHFRVLLTEVRRRSGMTQAELSAKLGRPQSFVAKYEGGEQRLDVVEFLLVCEALGVDPVELFAEFHRGVRG